MGVSRASRRCGRVFCTRASPVPSSDPLGGERLSGGVTRADNDLVFAGALSTHAQLYCSPGSWDSSSHAALGSDIARSDRDVGRRVRPDITQRRSGRILHSGAEGKTSESAEQLSRVRWRRSAERSSRAYRERGCEAGIHRAPAGEGAHADSGCELSSAHKPSRRDGRDVGDRAATALTYVVSIRNPRPWRVRRMSLLETSFRWESSLSRRARPGVDAPNGML